MVCLLLSLTVTASDYGDSIGLRTLDCNNPHHGQGSVGSMETKAGVYQKYKAHASQKPSFGSSGRKFHRNGSVLKALASSRPKITDK